jgi:hypothetical protein
MTTEEKLAAILAAVQVDPGNRGLARDPVDNLFTACPGDFEAACEFLVDQQRFRAFYGITGFPIPSTSPVRFETDGPLGLYFLQRAFMDSTRGDFRYFDAEQPIQNAIEACEKEIYKDDSHWLHRPGYSCKLFIERAGFATDGHCYSMRGSELDQHLDHVINSRNIQGRDNEHLIQTIAIGDGGNEIGMGKIPHETIVKNIPNGDLIHCRVPANYLIVAGVSNWGAYALAAGVFVLRGESPPSDLFDPDIEKRILEIMVQAGPLVDGVTGEQTATVDGLTWHDYIQPLLKMRTILGL